MVRMILVSSIWLYISASLFHPIDGSDSCLEICNIETLNGEARGLLHISDIRDLRINTILSNMMNIRRNKFNQTIALVYRYIRMLFDGKELEPHTIEGIDLSADGVFNDVLEHLEHCQTLESVSSKDHAKHQGLEILHQRLKWVMMFVYFDVIAFLGVQLDLEELFRPIMSLREETDYYKLISVNSEIMHQVNDILKKIKCNVGSVLVEEKTREYQLSHHGEIPIWQMLLNEESKPNNFYATKF